MYTKCIPTPTMPSILHWEYYLIVKHAENNMFKIERDLVKKSQPSDCLFKKSSLSKNVSEKLPPQWCAIGVVMPSCQLAEEQQQHLLVPDFAGNQVVFGTAWYGVQVGGWHSEPSLGTAALLFLAIQPQRVDGSSGAISRCQEAAQHAYTHGRHRSIFRSIGSAACFRSCNIMDAHRLVYCAWHGDSSSRCFTPSPWRRRL